MMLFLAGINLAFCAAWFATDAVLLPGKRERTMSFVMGAATATNALVAMVAGWAAA